MKMFIGLWKLIVFVTSIAMPFILRIIFKWNVRTFDLVFVALILTLFWCVVILGIELEKHKKQEPEKTEWPKLRFDEELLFVMALVARQEPMNGLVRYKRDRLATMYIKAFEGRDLGDFNGLISKLAARGYFDTAHVYPDAYCRITDEGFAYYEKHKKKKRWKNKLTKFPPPPSGANTTEAEVGSI